MRRVQALYLVVSAVVLTAVAAPLAIAANDGGGDGKAGAAQRGSVTGSSATFAGSNPRYTLLARNTNTGDGGAQANTCNSSTGNEACVNLVNFGNGYAGTLRTRGLTALRLQTSGSGQATPFELDANATGLVQYLNADTVDGLNASELRGQQGPAGVSGYQQVSNTSSSTTLAVGQNPLTVGVSCPSGKQAISWSATVNQTGNQNGGTAMTQGVGPVPGSSTSAQANFAVVGQQTTSEDPVNATFTGTVHAVCANT